MPGLELEVIADFKEEHWPSMDLAAEMLAVGLASERGVRCRFRRPEMWRFDGHGRPPRAFERALGRFAQYPALLLAAPRESRCFHVADHSYAHLVHVLPAPRTGVYCHDVDAFRALFDQTAPPSARLLSRLLASGLRRAAVVFHSTGAVRRELLARGLVRPERLCHAPYGVAPEFAKAPTSWDERVRRDHPENYLLHVGSTIARKNPAHLLRLFARLRATRGELFLVRVGGPFAPAERRLAEALGVLPFIVERDGLSRAELAALYRGARCVLLPSRAEGFGLPVIEAQACGQRPLLSDLEVLREVGGDAAVYAPVDDLDAWQAAAESLLDGQRGPDAAAVAHAAAFSWESHAKRIATAYHSLL